MIKLNNIEMQSIGGGQPPVESFTGQSCDFAGGMRAIAAGAIGGAAAGALGGLPGAASGAIVGGFAASATHTAGCILKQ
jgi:hypothetical protein